LRSRILFIVIAIVVLLAIYTFFIRQKVTRPSISRNITNSKTAIKEKATTVKEKTNNSKKKIAQLEKTVTQTVNPSQPTPELNQISTNQSEQESTKVLNWGSDPFVRQWILNSEIKDLKLKAITLSGKKAYALINDQILEVGEVIAGKSITFIEKDKVILEQGGRTFTLLLGEQ